MADQAGSPQARAARLMVWWILWFAILSGLVIMNFFIPAASSAAPGSPSALKYFPVIPLLIGAVIRWLVLPRAQDRSKALPLFIVGLAMSEACGILGMFVVPEMRSTYMALALLGVLQFAPFFAAKLEK